jgi:putative NADH-flavin reductase
MNYAKIQHMERITILGATGKTGNRLLKNAVERGYKVTVLVRNPEKLGEFKDKVNVVQGDITDEVALQSAINGNEAVLSVFGHVKGSQLDLQTKAFEKIIPLMEKGGVKRLIALTGAGIRTEGDKPKLVDKFVVGLMKVVAYKLLDDGYNFTNMIKQSNLDWTIVRGPVLTEDPGDKLYETGMVGSPNLTIKLSRDNLADAILDFLEKGQFIKEMPMVSNKK